MSEYGDKSYNEALSNILPKLHFVYSLILYQIWLGASVLKCKIKFPKL
jgi:hypothetical protein